MALSLRALAAVSLGSVTVLAGFGTNAQAATSSGYAITPAFQNIEVKANQGQAEFTLEITNNTAQGQDFSLTTTDFGSLDEEGGVAFLGQPASELAHKYGLASWMTLAKNLVTIGPGQSTQVTGTIDNRPSLAPGGHYGAVLATAVAASGPTTPGDSSVGVRQVLASLILLVKDGGGQAKLSLAAQTTDAKVWHLPTTIDQRFHNTGGVHVVPRGTIVVADPLGRAVERGVSDEASGAILPDSFRHYPATLMKLARAWVPGRYSVVSTYRYDGSNADTTITTHFWYIGTAAIWGGGVVALILAGLAGWLVWRRQKSRTKA